MQQAQIHRRHRFNFFHRIESQDGTGPLDHARPASILSSWAAIFATPLVALACILPLKVAGLVKFGDLSKDVTALAKMPVYFGILSQAGLVLWGVAAAVCLLAVVTLRRAGRSGWGLPASLGALSAMLLVDDMTQMHEHILPTYFGVDEVVVFAIYAVLFVSICWRFRRELPGTRLDLLLLTGGLFATSILTDIGPDFRFDVMAEDGAKLLGICGWAAYAGTLALGRMTPATADRPKT